MPVQKWSLSLHNFTSSAATMELPILMQPKFE